MALEERERIDALDREGEALVTAFRVNYAVTASEQHRHLEEAQAAYEARLGVDPWTIPDTEVDAVLAQLARESARPGVADAAAAERILRVMFQGAAQAAAAANAAPPPEAH